MCEIDRSEEITIVVTDLTGTESASERVFDRSNGRLTVPQGRTDRNVRLSECRALMADRRSDTAPIEMRFEFEVVENAHVRRNAIPNKNGYRLGERSTNTTRSLIGFSYYDCSLAGSITGRR